jgi:predicted extracellular nuclease
MKLTRLSLIIILMMGTASAFAQRKPVHFTAMFYNTENFYDTVNDPNTLDEEYLPSARIPWNTARYNLKTDHISEVMASVNSPVLPDIIGMAEIENRSVLESLVHSSKLKAGGYKIVHFDSPDERGIDVALLYKGSSFRLQKAIAMHVTLSSTDNDQTRDILYVKGIALKNTTIHIFINHWPSRNGGQDASEKNRIAAANVLRHQIDLILAADPLADILVMGDFNDNPTDKSISQVLSATAPESAYAKSGLYNLLSPLFKNGEGSLYYKSWDMFDQVIVSGNLLNPAGGLKCKPADAGIFKPAWLLYKNKDGVMLPNRTVSREYHGGYSDHLPVFVNFTLVR